MKRKYWLGFSDSDEHKPTEFEIFIVSNEDELQEAQSLVAERMADDFLTYEEYEGEDENA